MVGLNRAKTISWTTMLCIAPFLLGADKCGGSHEVCVCPEIWAPVCGDDGNTYGNECEAACSAVEVVHEGECRDTCACPEIWAPVCGDDGNTYGNECEADCANVDIAYEGQCRSDCICPDVWAPVCGIDGQTYGNTCEAGCTGTPIARAGECDSPPQYCWEDRECTAGERCNLEVCHSPCSFEGDGGESMGGAAPPEACPAVCYGVCTPDPEPQYCGSDPECGPREYCSLEDCPVCEEGEVCPAIACAGTCKPRPGPVCSDVLCDIYCPWGYERDADGCPTCGCVEPKPMYCSADNECGPEGICDFTECVSPCDDTPGAACLSVCYGVCRYRARL